MHVPSERAGDRAAPVRRRVILEPHARSAGRARAVVADLLEACDLGDLADTATLLVSELVTNAVLHTVTPVDLRCHVEARTVCVLVGDRSPVLPGMRHYDADALTGRGLGMVELLAAAWGVDAGDQGKTVWFQLAESGHDPSALPSVPEAGHGDWDGETFDVSFLGLPADLLLTTVQYGDSVLRELALTSIGGSAREGAPAWKAASIDLGPLLDAVHAAQRDGDGIDTVDVTVPFPAGAGAAAFERLALIDEADRMARDGVLLSAPALPEISACRRWMLSQVGLQEEGSAPVPWRLPTRLAPLREPARLPDGERSSLEALATGAIVADDANRIIYVNEPAATLLGWEVDELVGRRLVTIVPPELREAHLAGFSRYLITAEPRLLGRTVHLPALRRDGTRVDIGLILSTVDVGGGRVAFRADLS